MKTYQEMRDRYIAQRDAREAAITALEDVVVKMWREVIEEKMDTAYAAEDPRYSVSVYSNSICWDLRSGAHLDEAVARGAQRLVEFFVEAGFQARKIVCASGIGVEVSWDPDDN